MLRNVSVYINHHQGAHRLYFSKVTMLISVIDVVNEELRVQHLLQHVSVYIDHHQEAHRLCFAKVTVLISVVHVINEVFGAVAAYFVQSPCTCKSCTV